MTKVEPSLDDKLRNWPAHHMSRMNTDLDAFGTHNTSGQFV